MPLFFLLSTTQLNYSFMHIGFFFSVLSLKIAYFPQLRFQGNENSAWHCESLMQIILNLAEHQDNRSAAKQSFIKDSLRVPRV